MMPRDLKQALGATPLFFEPVPPSARSSPARAEQQLDELVRLLIDVGRIDAVDLPELVDENHDGKPYYRSGDPRVFAKALIDRTGRETIVNKVVAYLPSADALNAWARETIDRGIRHFVLVGGSSRYIPYPGPPVTEANRICRTHLITTGGLLGNIAIPQRTGEAHRLLSKTRAGASFFTTQILFDGEIAAKLLEEYDTLCRQAGIAPATIVLSVAPLTDEADAEFVRWLGADIPESAERAILNGEDTPSGARSVENALRVWTEVKDVANRLGLEVPLGINVEQISQRHLASAAEMVRAFSRALPPATTGDD